MTPSNAILATLLVPGSAHFTLGKPVRGVVALLSTVGLFFAGWAILGDRLFHGVLFEPFDLLAPVMRWVPINLLPEVPNLGCSVIASVLRDLPSNPSELHEALRRVRLPVPGEEYAFFMTSASGILACLWAADAQSLALGAYPAKRNRAFVAGVSWLVPGAGHFLIGQKDKALLMGGAVVAMFLLGMAFSDFLPVDRAHHNAYWIPQSLFGGGLLVSSLGFAQLEIPDPIPLRYSLGVTLTSIAGLMNLVVMIDAYTVLDRAARKEATPV